MKAKINEKISELKLELGKLEQEKLSAEKIVKDLEEEDEYIEYECYEDIAYIDGKIDRINEELKFLKSLIE